MMNKLHFLVGYSHGVCSASSTWEIITEVNIRNINNLRYADDTTLMAESKEELKSFSMKVKEESETVGLKFNIQKMNIMASGPIISWHIDGKQWKQ